jgi:uncharacterized NAD(P)/FAD-binding protein YdhS
MSHDNLPLAVIGAGFSGTMTALHLLRRSEHRPLLLCEQSNVFARGAAYSTDDPVHLLNVRSANMSAYLDEPEHFARWVEKQVATSGSEEIVRQVQETTVGTFVSRSLYGRYLTSLVREAIGADDGATRLRLVPDEVVDLEPTDHGYQLTLAGGRQHAVAGAILAVGNLLPNQGGDGPYFANPWASSLTAGLEPGEPVVIVGSGLTMVDITMQLWSSGFPGPVIAISRRGLLPHTHALSAPWPVPDLDQGEKRSLARLLRRIRQEVAAARRQGIGWQNVVDSLRPITAATWQNLPPAEQERFLRHARPWWDVHRHRTAPPIAQQIHGLIEQGYLSIRAGRITAIETGARRATVSYRPRGGSEIVSIAAQRVVNATGALPASDVKAPLLQRLRERGLFRLDRHRLGIDVTDRLEVIGAAGEVTPRLWALGPVVRGMFWECTAVPDIRRQAVELADRIVEELSPRFAKRRSALR